MKWYRLHNESKDSDSNPKGELAFKGIPELYVAKMDSFFDLPKTLEYKGQKIDIQDLATKVSHRTIKRPRNAPFDVDIDHLMLRKAERSNPVLFKTTLLAILNGKTPPAWWDATKSKWESDENVLSRKNSKRDKDEDYALLMNGL